MTPLLPQPTDADGGHAMSTERPVPASVSARAAAVPALGLVPAHHPYHPRSEQLRLLRTELLLRHDAPGRANMLAIVSPGAGDGRSQLAAELAIAFAQLGQPTLLVDADLRNPTQHRLFNTGNDSGLASAILLGTDPALQRVAGLPSLSLLTAGPAVANPLELLSDRRFENRVREWRQRFSYVVFDTPAIGRYADALAVATVTRRVLSLSRAGHTTLNDARTMMRRLEATRSRMLGAVLGHRG